MRKFIIYLSLLTLAIVATRIASHYSNPKTAGAIITGATVEQASASEQPRVPPAITINSKHSAIAVKRPATAPAKQAALRAFAQLPLDFEANRGQAPAGFDFVSHGPGYVLGLSPGIARLSVQRVTKRRSSMVTPETFGTDVPQRIESSPLELQLVGANADAKASGIGEQPGRSNYFIGNDPSKWQTQVPHFNRVKMAGVYPGVDLDYYGNPQQLEYDFLVSPQADPKNIRLQIHGASRIHLDNAGNAVLRTAAGEVQLKRPVSYQEIAGVRHPVESKFKFDAGRQLQFELGPYDRSQPLVIDPVLISAVSLGGQSGTQQTEATDVELDSGGNVYVTGYTCAADFPSTAGPFQNSNINPVAKTCETSFVTKFDPTLATMLYSDFIGGSEVTLSWYMAVDASGNAFVTGATNSSDFPTVNNQGRTVALTPCALSKTNAFNCPVGFLLKLSADGSQIIFSDLMGGSQASGGHAVELNPVTNEVVVLGATNSSDFQPAPTTLQTTFSGTNCTVVAIPCFETFLYGFDPNTGAVRYGTFLGGANNNFGAGLEIDSSGNIYVAGSTQPPFASALGPVTTTVAPAGGATAGGTDIFVMKLNHSAQNVLTVNYITVIQGEADDAAASLALDSSNNAYIVGASASLHLAVTPGVFQSTNTSLNGNDCHFDTPAMAPFLPNACGNAFVAKLTPTGALSFLTYLGGTGQEAGEAIGLDSLGNIWVGGITSSTTGFPFSADAYPQTGAIFDLATPFLAEMSSDGTKVPFATAIASILGQVTSITTDGNANIFVTGFSSAVPITPGVFPAVPNSFEPGFVQKWNVGPQPALQLSATNLMFPDTAMGGVSPSQTVTVTNTGAGTMELSLQMQLQQGVFPGDVPPDFVETSNCGTTLASNANCTITVAFAPGPPSLLCIEELGCPLQSRSGQILVTTNAPGSPATITFGGNTGNGALLSISPTPIVFPAQAAGTSSAPMDISILNSGDVTLNFTNFAITQVGGSDFTVATTSPDFKTCTTPTGPSIFCGVAITFSPAASATGTRTAQLVLTDSAGDSPQSIQITGTVAGTNALNVSPTSIAIGPVAIGNSGTSSLKNVTLSNPTTTAVTVNGFNITGDTTDFSVSNGSCASLPPFTIAGGASCFVSVIFGPAAGSSGLRTATLTITSPQAANIPPIPLSAEAVSNTDPALTYFSVPSPLNLGTVPLGQTSNNSSAFLVIENTAPIPCAGGAPSCGGPLTVTSITPGISDYVIGVPQGAAYCTAPPFTIPAGNNGCTIALMFAPTAVGPRNTSLVVTSNDPQGPVLIPLSGTGVTIGIVEASPTSINFGSSQIGVVSPQQIVTFRNAGSGAMNPGTVIASANFTVSANNCTSSVPAGGSCTVAVTFTPPSAGPFSGTLTFTNDAAYGGRQVVALSGSGATGPLLLVSPAAIQFSNQPVGTTSLAQTITLTSTGNTAVTFPANAIRVSTDFVISATTCGASLATGASCTVNIQYRPSPSASSFEGGTVSFTDNAPGNPQSVALTGNTDATGTTATTATLISSANPVAAGQPVTFTVAVSAQNSQIPTGPVLFLDGVNTLASVFLDATGHATFTTSALAPGSHPIAAAYTGGPLFNNATSAVVNQVITGTNPMPTISGLSPAGVTAGSGAFTLTVNGTNFISSSSVLFNGTARTTTFVNSTQLMAAILASDVASTGEPTVAVSNPAPGGGQSNLVNFSVITGANNPVPTLTSISPNTVSAGVPAFTMTLTGANFVSNSVVDWNGAPQPTTFVNATTLMATIFAAEVQSVGSALVTVVNPTPAGGTSNSAVFEITTPVAVLSSLVPNSAIAGGAAFTLTVNGSNFENTAVVQWNGANLVTTFGSATQLTAAVPATDIASVGTASVVVFNPAPAGGANAIRRQIAPSGTFSNALTFTINASNPAPNLTSMTPSTVSAGSPGFTIMLTGSGFISSSVAQWNGVARTTTFVSATQLTAAITAVDIAASGTAAITVVNPTPGGGTSNSLTFTITDFSVSATTTSQTVTAGQPANFTIATATVGGAFPGTVTFTASGLPTGASVSFNPSSVTAGTSTTMTVTTTARGLAQIATPPSAPNNPTRLLWLVTLAILLTLMLALASAAKFGRRTARRLVPIGAFALLLISVGYISGCSGGGFPKVGSGGTPAGTYTVTVTGTSGADVHSTTVTLTVQLKII